MNIILLASSAPQVGKSTFADTLLRTIPQSVKYSFAYPIKEITYNLYKDVMSKFGKEPEVSFLEYSQTKKEVSLTDTFKTTPRHQYCDASLFLSSLTTDTVWGDLARYNISTLDIGANTVIIDDWRREIEHDCLSSHFNCKTIYLDKVDVESYKGTAATESFEGQIDRDKCDLQFVFNEDWSNTQDLLEQVKGLLKTDA